MVIQIDTREKARAITKILRHFDSSGVKHFSSKLPVGDYVNLDRPRLSIDRKQSLSELCQNVCQDHKRFRAELERAKELGIHLVILCEHGGNIRCLADVMRWENPRLKISPMAMSGERLFKVLSAMANKYDTEFLFCSKNETGKRIVELLRSPEEM